MFIEIAGKTIAVPRMHHQKDTVNTSLTQKDRAIRMGNGRTDNKPDGNFKRLIKIEELKEV